LKITSFVPTADLKARHGLNDVNFHRLGPTVVLAGPNGGGKTRILNALREVFAHQHDRVQTRKFRKAELDNSVSSLKLAIRQNESQESLANRQRTIESFQHEVDAYEQVQIEPDGPKVRLVNFVPKNLALTEVESLRKEEIRVRTEAIAQIGADELNERALSYLQRKQDMWFEATHQNFQGTKEFRQKAVDDYESLNNLLKKLLDDQLERVDGITKIFGRPIANREFSDGQKVLIQLAVAVHPHRDDEDIVFILDEPENHLHPAALLTVIDRIHNSFPNTQLWIATHSVPLIAHLYAQDSKSLHFVSKGSVVFAGTKPLTVLEGLIGEEDERNKLLQFTDLSSNLASAQFAAECIAAPTVAEHVSKDAQNQQIRQSISTARLNASPLRLLDFGAGKGRLLAGLLEEGDSQVPPWLDYVAFDSSDKDRPVCEMQLERTYGSSDRRWHRTADQLLSIHGEHTFHVVVMCNVMHEIPPDEWLTIFSENGIIKKALSLGGHLLIVEDLRIPVGELPNPRGFFLLNRIHVLKLFGAEINDLDSVLTNEQRDGRLVAHLIPFRLLSRVSDVTRRETILALRATAIDKLKEIRSTTDRSYKSGQENGFWSQQLANCCLYLESIGSPI
jgi:ABC-type cobalamin/Fe3+-siderophores transport system ATPase subunit